MVFFWDEEHRSGLVLVHSKLLLKTPKKLPSEFCTRIFNLSFLANAYLIHYDTQISSTSCRSRANPYRVARNPNVLKIAMVCSDATSFNPHYPRLRDLKAVAHLKADRKLAVLSLGGVVMNNQWETGFCDITFDDIVTYKGQLYGVDEFGGAFVMDYHSLHMARVAPALPDPSSAFVKLRGLPGNDKLMHLVVFSGDLYMFVRGFSGNNNIATPRLYRLSSRRHRWLEADHDLPHYVFIQNVMCNFAVAKGLLRKGMMKYKVPRFYSFPDFIYVLVVNPGLDHVYELYDQPILSSSANPKGIRYCDLFHSSVQ